jgi:hypothetical protein
MMETAGTSETSENFYQTTGRNISEDSHLHTRGLENLKSQQGIIDLGSMKGGVFLEIYEVRPMLPFLARLHANTTNKCSLITEMQLSHLSCPLLKNVLYSNCHLRSS